MNQLLRIMKSGGRNFFRNLWLFGPLVKAILGASHMTNAMIRTTYAPTMLQGSATEKAFSEKLNRTGSSFAGASMCSGALMLVGLAPDTSLSWVLASYVVFGLGCGLVNAPITNTALSGMPRSQATSQAMIPARPHIFGDCLPPPVHRPSGG